MHPRQLRIGFIGSGFIARFHLRSLIGIRNAVVTGVYSPSVARRQSFALQAQELGLGPCTPRESLRALVCAADVDALWIVAPNHERIAIMKEIHRYVTSGESHVFAVACEKPLARTIAEAREMLRLSTAAGLNHGYLENQVFSSGVQAGKEIIWRRAVPSGGRPYIARASEEHGGPHEPWFWQGEKQGGGALSDMMCHSVEVGRYLLTAPNEPRASLRPVSVTATVANLKWTRPRYADWLRTNMGTQVDYRRRPSEDFARGLVRFEDPEGQEVIVEAAASWAYVGAGLRIQLELLGPEYSMDFNTLQSGLNVFLSRNIEGGQGEDLVEKQNAEQGQMPVLPDEATIYGYTLENRHMVESFLLGRPPIETFEDGLGVVELLMAMYRSAEIGAVVHFPLEGLEDYVPLVARPA